MPAVLNFKVFLNINKNFWRSFAIYLHLRLHVIKMITIRLPAITATPNPPTEIPTIVAVETLPGSAVETMPGSAVDQNSTPVIRH